MKSNDIAALIAYRMQRAEDSFDYVDFAEPDQELVESYLKQGREFICHKTTPTGQGF